MIAIPPDHPQADDGPTIAELAVDKMSGYFALQLRDGTLIRYERLERVGNMMRLYAADPSGPIGNWSATISFVEVLASDVLIWGLLERRP